MTCLNNRRIVGLVVRIPKPFAVERRLRRRRKSIPHEVWYHTAVQIAAIAGTLIRAAGGEVLPVGGASRRDDKIAWYENVDGQGSFADQRVISLEADDARSVYAADLDGDGALDVLSASYPGRVAWYENLDGDGHFGEQSVIPTRLIHSTSVTSADVDGDGDVDVLSATYSEGRFAWYENRLLADSNDNGVFDSSDLVMVFQAGKYEDGIDDNATFDEGDWNLDGDFDSSDLVLAFQAGHYEAGARPLAAEIAAAIDWLFAQDDDAKRARAFVA